MVQGANFRPTGNQAPVVRDALFRTGERRTDATQNTAQQNATQGKKVNLGMLLGGLLAGVMASRGGRSGRGGGAAIAALLAAYAMGDRKKPENAGNPAEETPAGETTPPPVTQPRRQRLDNGVVLDRA